MNDKTIPILDFKKNEFNKTEFYWNELKAQMDLDGHYVPKESWLFNHMMKMIKEIHENLDKIAKHINIEVDLK
jgi:hypothetical protein